MKPAAVCLLVVIYDGDLVNERHMGGETFRIGLFMVGSLELADSERHFKNVALNNI